MTEAGAGEAIHPTQQPRPPWSTLTWQGILAALVLLTLLVQGYHPLAEDGGLYVAGVQWKLNPSLFPQYTDFVTEHLRFSIFSNVLAAFVRITHIPLTWTLLLVDLLSLWLTFYAARQILRRCIASEAAQLTGMALLGAWWTLPIAGTSLLLMDPYVTARSLSTPLSLLAVALALDDWRSVPGSAAHTMTSATRSWLSCATCLILASLFHPLMAIYAIALVIVLRLMRLRSNLLALALFAAIALALAATLQALAPAESPAFVAAAITRYYWFLSQWQWFELLGLAGPLVVLSLLLRTRRAGLTPSAMLLCRACIAVGALALLIALAFAHESYRTHLVARLQPLRIFLLLYAVMALLIGATLSEFCAIRSEQCGSASLRRLLHNAPAVFVVLMATTMLFVQRNVFPGSIHLELPWRAAHNPNPWVRAFLWSRANTPPGALFALDAKYVNTDGEDAQTFRATAQRSALPDYSKDGGEASITPALAATWQQSAAAQKSLSTESDAVRDAKLKPYGVTWMILHSGSRTSHPCPYANDTVKVCRLVP